MEKNEFYLAFIYYKDGREKELSAKNKEMLDLKIYMTVGDNTDDIKIINVYHVNKIEEIIYESAEETNDTDN